MQLALSGLNLPAARPLIPIEACMVLLDRGEDEVLKAIETGVLGWAWDIGAAGASRRELRVWRDSILALILGEKERELDEAAVFAQWLPPRDIRSPELQRLWSCSSTHIHALIDMGELVTTGTPNSLRGPTSYAMITRGSVAAFLKRRRAT